MKWRYRLFAVMMVLWLPLMAAAFFAVDSGMAASYVPASLLPSSTETTAVGAAGLAVVGFVVFGRLRARTWRRIGREAGLQADGSGKLITRSGGHGLFTLMTTPDLAGTVDGRPVRVSTHKESTGSGEESGSETHTIVEAELDGPPARSAILTLSDGAPIGDVAGFAPAELETTVDGNVAVVGTGGESFVGEVLSDRARDRIQALGGSNEIVVGNPTDVFLDELSDEMGGLGGMVIGGLRQKLEENSAFDSETVAISSSRRVLEPDELRRQAEAVAAVAAGVERAEAGPEPA